MSNSKKFQSWNGRNGKYILFDNGKIVKTSDKKFPGVFVKKDKSGKVSSKKESGTDSVNSDKKDSNKSGRKKNRWIFGS